MLPPVLQYAKDNPHKLRKGFKVALAIGAVTASARILVPYIQQVVQKRQKVVQNGQNGLVKTAETGRNRTHPKIDAVFLHQLKRLIKIMIPRLLCKESGVLALHSSTLVARTFLTLYVGFLEGRIVKCIVQKDMKEFVRHMLKWVLVAIPATFINSMIRFFESYLGVAFRSRLVQHTYKLYLENQTYYKVSNLDNRLTNADQCLTEDITVFAQSVARLYSQLTKPLLDVVLITGTLVTGAIKRGSESVGWLPLMAGGIIMMTVRVLRAISPKFGQLVSEEAARKGHLRYLHSRIITNAEEIAFYGGHKVELIQLSDAFRSLREQMVLIYRKKILYIMMEQFLMKYIWSGTGMAIVAIPILTARYADDKGSITLESQTDGGVSERTRAFTTAKNLLSSGADAVERLMTSLKEVTELAGHTSRVWQMLDVFEDVNRGNFVRVATQAETARDGTRWDTTDIKGTVVDSADSIQLENVPIVTPSGDCLVDNISITIHSGMHFLITGPNGAGKSSLFRIVGGLWPVYRGIVHKPPSSLIFYIPQRPYMTLGTLRDQVIYPDTVELMHDKGIDDAHLVEILRIVHLLYIVDREGGWDSRNDWMDLLSGGEKQRMGLARMFYHRPQFALLDECTSAVSMDVEGKIYQEAKDVGITLLTVTHRPSLWKYHTHVLQLDGEGGWRVDVLDASIDSKLSLTEEKRTLQLQLENMPKIQNRLTEVKQLLDDEPVPVDNNNETDILEVLGSTI